MCPDATMRQWRHIFLGSYWQPAICISKQCSWALGCSHGKLNGLSLQALWGVRHWDSGLPASGPWPHYLQGCPVPPGTPQSQGNSPNDVSCPHLQTAPVWDWQEGSIQIHVNRGRPCSLPSPGQGETEAKKAEVEQASGQAGREGGKTERIIQRKSPAAHKDIQSKPQNHKQCAIPFDKTITQASKKKIWGTR